MSQLLLRSDQGLLFAIPSAFFQRKRELFFFRAVTVIVFVYKFLHFYGISVCLGGQNAFITHSTVQSHKLVSEELVNRSYGLSYH